MPGGPVCRKYGGNLRNGRVTVVLELMPLRGEQIFKPRPRRDSLQNFRRVSPSFLNRRTPHPPSPKKVINKKLAKTKYFFRRFRPCLSGLCIILRAFLILVFIPLLGTQLKRRLSLMPQQLTATLCTFLSKMNLSLLNFISSLIVE